MLAWVESSIEAANVGQTNVHLLNGLDLVLAWVESSIEAGNVEQTNVHLSNGSVMGKEECSVEAASI